VTEEPEDRNPESEGASDAESAGAGEAGEGESRVPRADSAPDAPPTEGDPDTADDEARDEAPAPEEPAPDAPVAEGGEGATAESEPEGPDAESTRAPAAPAAEAAEGAPVDDAAAPTGDETPEEEFEYTPRAKPEIPGADLEPVFIPQEEEYLDAEAQAAAEAEAEAAAERARAEAEDERARPIADAAIDLAAGARYTATGKRKTAVARVILKPGGGEYAINGKPLEHVFPRETLQRMIRQPLETVGYESRMDVVARMHGGGVSAQAGALRHGISRALIVADPNLRGELKRRGFLTRDPRVKERKKAGLKKARKRPQFSKR
jgi:small subunit ribosomal protein S9